MKAKQYFIVHLAISAKATPAEQDSYEAALVLFSKYLFEERLGTWGGRETAIKPNDAAYPRSNYWYVLVQENAHLLESTSMGKLQSILRNLRLSKCTIYSKSASMPADAALLKDINQDKLAWVYYRTKPRPQK